MGPQCEDGYTRIANELLEALCRTRVPGEAMQIFLVILRKTYGYKKKVDAIALSQFVTATGIVKTHVSRAIEKLVQMNMIVTQKGNGITVTYEINKHYDTWRPLPKKVTLPKKVIKVTQKGNLPLPKKGTTKDNITKERKKDVCADFESFYSLFPKHKARADAEKAWRQMSPPLDAVMAALEWQNQQPDWLKENGKYIPLPASWLRGKRWEDEQDNGPNQDRQESEESDALSYQPPETQERLKRQLAYMEQKEAELNA